MAHTDCSCQDMTGMTRRGFLNKVALGAGVAMFASFAPRVSLAAGSTEALLLSCMDYRLIDDIVRYMDGRGMTDKYDHVVLAGASLGVLNDKNTAWGQTFWDHVDVALQLHHIHKIIVMDHRDCGAYKVFLGPDHAKDAATEFESHAAKLRALQAQIKAKFPQLEVELLLMALDGSVASVPAA
jgi:carbonic anhydrase